MDGNVKPDFVFCGGSRCASTWIYKSLYDHPDVFVPDIKPVDYFSIKYGQGDEWYQDVFSGYDGTESTVGDVSTSYLKVPQAAERLGEALPNAELVFCLRNPFERAYSDWWRNQYSDTFDSVFRNHHMYDTWLREGFYGRHLDRFGEHFPDDQIHVLFFDDLKADDAAFARSLYEAVGVDDSHVPTFVDQRVNEAFHEAPTWYERLKRLLAVYPPEPIKEGILRPVYERVRPLFEDRSEYDEGMDPNVRKQLEVVFAEDVQRLEARTGRDLDHWFEYVDLGGGPAARQVSYDESYVAEAPHWQTVDEAVVPD